MTFLNKLDSARMKIAITSNVRSKRRNSWNRRLPYCYVSDQAIVHGFNWSFESVETNSTWQKEVSDWGRWSTVPMLAIPGNTLLWIDSLLSNQQQCVVVDGEKFSCLPLLWRVPPRFSYWISFFSFCTLMTFLSMLNQPFTCSLRILSRT